MINYATSGYRAFIAHMQSKKHVQAMHLRLTNTALPNASAASEKSKKDGLYGSASLFKQAEDVVREDPVPAPAVHIKDSVQCRIDNLGRHSRTLTSISNGASYC